MQERQRRLTLSMKYQSKIDFGRGINQLSPTPFLVTTIAAVLTNETDQNRPLWAKKAKGVRRSHSVRGYVKIKYRSRGIGMFLCPFSDLFLSNVSSSSELLLEFFSGTFAAIFQVWSHGLATLPQTSICFARNLLEPPKSHVFCGHSI